MREKDKSEVRGTEKGEMERGQRGEMYGHDCEIQVTERAQLRSSITVTFIIIPVTFIISYSYVHLHDFKISVTFITAKNVSSISRPVGQVGF